MKGNLLSFYLIGRNEGELTKTAYAPKGNLHRCLTSLRKYAPNAEIVFVEGGPSSDDTMEIARSLADVATTYLGPEGNWTKEMLAFTDAAAARNHALSLCHGDFCGWVDADDTLAWGKLAEKICKANAIPWPGEMAGIDEILTQMRERKLDICLGAAYAYKWHDWDAGESGTDYLCDAWQETVLRIHPNNGHWRFERAAHEVLRYTEGSAQVQPLPGLIWVHHKKLDAAATKYSRDRHFAIIWPHHKAGTADITDYTYLLRFLEADAKLVSPEEADALVARAIELAEIPKQKYIVWKAIGRLRAIQGDLRSAETFFSAAHALFPSIPDAALDAGEFYSQLKRWDFAAHWYQRALAGKLEPIVSSATPHEFAVEAPKSYATALRGLAASLRESGRVAEAEACEAEATKISA